MSSTQGQLLAKLRHDAQQVVYQQRGLHSMLAEWNEMEAEFQEIEALAMDEVLKSTLIREKLNRELKHAGYQDLGAQEWKPPLGKVPNYISEKCPKCFDTGGPSQACDCMLFRNEITTGKAFQMEPVKPGTITQDEALGAVLASEDKVEALARVLCRADACDEVGEDSWDPTCLAACESYRRQARAAIAHQRKRPEGLPSREELAHIMFSATGGDDANYSGRIKELHLVVADAILAALAPYLRDPVGKPELDVTAIEIANTIHTASVGAISEMWKDTAAQRVLDLCRSRIRPTHKCKECAKMKQRLHYAAEAWRKIRDDEASDALDAALEGE